MLAGVDLSTEHMLICSSEQIMMEYFLANPNNLDVADLNNLLHQRKKTKHIKLR